MKLIELHILQSFPVSCLNRDDMGTPKTAMFGGCKRARISSQCLKRAQRMLFRELLPEFSKGERTKLLASAFYKQISELPDANTFPQDLHITLAEAWGKTDSSKKSADGMQKSSTLTYLSPAEINAMIDAALKLLQENPKAKAAEIQKVALKAVKGALSKDAADIALYGRMVASESSLTLEGAAMFSHAISTHRAEPELDFYAAVDDLQSTEEQGAGMTGMLEFSSACYYRYVALNVDLLKTHLADLSEAHINEIVAAFIRASVMAVPSARKNSMNASTAPSFVLGIVRSGHPLQLVNAFEKPIRCADGYTNASIDELKNEFARMRSVWGITTDVESSLPDTDLNSFISAIVEALK